MVPATGETTANRFEVFNTQMTGSKLREAEVLQVKEMSIEGMLRQLGISDASGQLFLRAKTITVCGRPFLGIRKPIL